MKEIIYMIFSRTRARRITKTHPQLNGNEIAIKLNLIIPDKFFDRFIPEIELTIPEEYVIEPKLVAQIIEMDQKELTELEKTIKVELEKFVEPVEIDENSENENPEDNKVDHRNPLGDIFDGGKWNV